MVGIDHITSFCQILVFPNNHGIDWEVIIAGVAAVIAGVTAYINYSQNKARLRPILSYKGKSDIDEDLSGFLKFQNVGQGAGTLLGVDLYPKNTGIKCHIATPLSIGPKSEAKLQVWLDEADYNYLVTFTLYYWDIAKRCHATQTQFVLEYQTKHTYSIRNKDGLEVREPMEHIKEFYKLPFQYWHPKRLTKLHHWDHEIPRDYINSFSNNKTASR